MTACAHAVHSFGGSPMTDVGYLCQNCGSVHEVESVRENLILDLHTAASYELSGQRGMLDPRARFLRWRLTGSVSPSGPAGSRRCRPARRRSPPRPWRCRVRP